MTKILDLADIFKLPQVRYPDLRELFDIPEDSGYRIQLGEDGRVEEVYWFDDGERVTKTFEPGTGILYESVG